MKILGGFWIELLKNVMILSICSFVEIERITITNLKRAAKVNVDIEYAQGVAESFRSSEKRRVTTFDCKMCVVLTTHENHYFPSNLI